MRKTLLVLLPLALAGCGGGGSLVDRVADRVDESVVCSVTRTLAIAGEDRDIYACEGEANGDSVGCFAIVKDELFDATALVRALDNVKGVTPAC